MKSRRLISDHQHYSVHDIVNIYETADQGSPYHVGDVMKAVSLKCSFWWRADIAGEGGLC